MTDWPATFHFLRPWALWGLLPILLLLLRVGVGGSMALWRRRIDPHLLAALTVGGRRRPGLRPVDTLALALALGCIGLAGPAWQREPIPLAEDRAPLVVALDLSASMDAVDVSPTRLERAKLKLRELLARRQGARTGLLVFGASAHRVLPLTEDPNLLLAYLPDLSTALMPAQPAARAKATAAALALAEKMLEREPVPGSVLFLTDGFEPAQAQDFVRFRESGRNEVLLLAFGGDAAVPLRRADGGYVSDGAGRRLLVRLGRAGLEQAAAAGLWLASATVGSQDIDALESRIQRHLAQALAADPGARWRDEGIWLVWPAALLLLCSFRPGWAVRWGQALVVPLSVVLLGLGGPAGEARAGEQGWRDWRFADLWASRDQQGRWHFERGDFEGAAAAFADPLWRGIALYRAGRFAAAADAFAAVPGAEGQYNLGNALAQLRRYPEAVATYDQALALRPGWPAARHNRELVARLIPREDEDSSDRAGEADPDELDQSPFGKKKGRKLTQRRPLTEAEITRLWLARIQLSPAGYLKNRFAMEAREGRRGEP